MTKTLNPSTGLYEADPIRTSPNYTASLHTRVVALEKQLAKQQPIVPKVPVYN